MDARPHTSPGELLALHAEQIRQLHCELSEHAEQLARSRLAHRDAVNDLRDARDAIQRLAAENESLRRHVERLEAFEAQVFREAEELGTRGDGLGTSDDDVYEAPLELVDWPFLPGGRSVVCASNKIEFLFRAPCGRPGAVIILGPCRHAIREIFDRLFRTEDQGR
jgi:hypothetical protein